VTFNNRHVEKKKEKNKKHWKKKFRKGAGGDERQKKRLAKSGEVQKTKNKLFKVGGQLSSK